MPPKKKSPAGTDGAAAPTMSRSVKPVPGGEVLAAVTSSPHPDMPKNAAMTRSGKAKKSATPRPGKAKDGTTPRPVKARDASTPHTDRAAGDAIARPGKAKAAARRPKSATIEDAIELAVKAHRGQTDKYHLPYILHVFGVAARCRTIEEKIVAFLHDAVEDGHTTFAELRRLGFTERVIDAVEKLTRRKGESYEAFVERIAPNALARVVKLADLEDNMDVRRSDRAMKVKDAERMEKYRKAWQKLAALVVSEES